MRTNGSLVVVAVLAWASACGDSVVTLVTDGASGGSTEVATSTSAPDDTPTTTIADDTTLGSMSDSLGGSTTEDAPTTGVAAFCGDGEVGPGEGCDDGEDNGGMNVCKADCTVNFCGDGVVGPGEGCDDANRNDDDECTNACALVGCGDGIVAPTEECDDGNPDNTDACTAACTNAACSDGFAQPSNLEECDDGPANADDAACTAACTLAVCGDGKLYLEAEACDDENMDPTDACTNTCEVAACGDGFVRADVEECDDANVNDTDGCSAACEKEVVLQVTAGASHVCARLSGGQVKCWGQGGSLGLGDKLDRGNMPGEMGAALPVIDLGEGLSAASFSAGPGHTCAVLADGRVKCWGVNADGALGLGDTANRGDGPGEMGDSLPAVDLGQGKVATAVDVAFHTTCALLSGGTVKCWGRNDNGQLGQGDTNTRGDGPGEMGDLLLVVDLGQGKIAKAVSVGSYHACALLSGGTVKCWGRNSEGQLGLGDTLRRGDGPGEMGDALPVVALAGPVSAVSCGAFHSCALLVDGRIQCWGNNGAGHLGLGDTNRRGDGPGEMGPNLPTVALGAGKLAVAVRAADDMTCAHLSDGAVKCWGQGGFLGIGDPSNRGDAANEMGDDLPVVNLGAGLTVASFDVSSLTTCAVLQDSTVKCWGRNISGQLGLGDTLNRGDGPGEMGDALPRLKLFNDAY